MYDRLETLNANLVAEKVVKIAVPVSDGLIFIKVDDISHIDADGSYSKIWTTNGSNVLVSKKLKYFEEILQNQAVFYRVHRSSILNMRSIQKYSRHDSLAILENGTKIKVARDNKVEFEEALKEIHSTS